MPPVPWCPPCRGLKRPQSRFWPTWREPHLRGFPSAWPEVPEPLFALLHEIGEGSLPTPLHSLAELGHSSGPLLEMGGAEQSPRQSACLHSQAWRHKGAPTSQSFPHPKLGSSSWGLPCRMAAEGVPSPHTAGRLKQVPRPDACMCSRVWERTPLSSGVEPSSSLVPGCSRDREGGFPSAPWGGAALGWGTLGQKKPPEVGAPLYPHAWLHRQVTWSRRLLPPPICCCH